MEVREPVLEEQLMVLSAVRVSLDLELEAEAESVELELELELELVVLEEALAERQPVCNQVFHQHEASLMGPAEPEHFLIRLDFQEAREVVEVVVLDLIMDKAEGTVVLGEVVEVVVLT